VAFLEAQFAIKVLDEELIPGNLDSVAQISEFVAAKQSANNVTIGA
jgi:hypothetical protein